VGHGKLRSAAADSGPLIHLAEINCLRLLRIFDSVCVPDAVWLETVGKDRIPHDDLAAECNLQRYSAPRLELVSFIKKNNLADLHLGEQECLFLCQKREVTTLLTDDMAVRDAAHRLDLVPVGSLGIIVAAYEHDVISHDDAKRYIADLYDVSSLFVTRDLVDMAIGNLRPHPKH
jgi:predicted nucleic acid-binding protein